MIAKLVTVNPLTSSSVEISKSNFSVGRNANNDLVVQDIKVSQFHLTIELKESEFVLKDLSSNGTYVNNNKVGKGNSVKILNGDVLHLLPQGRIKPQEIVGFKFEIPEVVQVQKVEPINRQHSEEKIQKQPEPQKKEDNKIEAPIEPKVSQIVNEPPQKSQIIQQIEGLEEELECTICNDYLFEAVSINPCNHHFCGACLSNWLKKGTQDCPNCRKKLTGIMVARTINNLVEKWLKGNLQAKRTEGLIEKMKEENLIYKNPEKYQNFAVAQQQLKVKDFKNYVENYNSEDDENYDQDEEEHDDDDEYLSNESFDDNNPLKKFQQPQVPLFQNQNNNIFGGGFGGAFGGGFGAGYGFGGGFGKQAYGYGGVPAFGGLFQNQAKACKSCNGQQWKGYQCPDNQVHVGCASCARQMPKRELTEEENEKFQMHCVICKAYHCNFYYGDCAQGQLQKFMLVEGIKHQMVIPVNFVNYTEYTRLLKHLAGRPQVSIFNFMFEHYISKGYFYFEQNKSTYNFPLQEINVKITPKTPICWLCHRKLINFIIFRYIQCIKYDDPIFQNEDCRYGINCRNQLRDQAHCVRYNHVCEQTKFE